MCLIRLAAHNPWSKYLFPIVQLLEQTVKVCVVINLTWSFRRWNVDISHQIDTKTSATTPSKKKQGSCLFDFRSYNWNGYCKRQTICRLNCGVICLDLVFMLANCKIWTVFAEKKKKDKKIYKEPNIDVVNRASYLVMCFNKLLFHTFLILIWQIPLWC